MMDIRHSACMFWLIAKVWNEKKNNSSQLYTLMYQTKYLILYYQLQGKIKPTYLRNRSVLK